MAQNRNGTLLPLHSRTLRHPNNTINTSTPQSRGRLPGPQTTWTPPKHHNGRLHRRRANLSGVVPNKIRNELIAFIAEFCGTFMFLFFAFVGTQVANEAATAAAGNAENAHHSLSQAPNATTLLYISLSFGFSLAVNVWIFFRISGGLFNPVVSQATSSAYPPLPLLPFLLPPYLLSYCTPLHIAASWLTQPPI